MMKGLFLILSDIFKLHHNRIVLSLQFRKPERKSHESAQESMGKLWTKAVVYD